jgi:hypothetical protein
MNEEYFEEYRTRPIDSAVADMQKGFIIEEYKDNGEE